MSVLNFYDTLNGLISQLQCSSYDCDNRIDYDTAERLFNFIDESSSCSSADEIVTLAVKHDFEFGSEQEVEMLLEALLKFRDNTSNGLGVTELTDDLLVNVTGGVVPAIPVAVMWIAGILSTGGAGVGAYFGVKELLD